MSKSSIALIGFLAGLLFYRYELHYVFVAGIVTTIVLIFIIEERHGLLLRLRRATKKRRRTKRLAMRNKG